MLAWTWGIPLPIRDLYETGDPGFVELCRQAVMDTHKHRVEAARKHAG